jgi:hypothetical protein
MADIDASSGGMTLLDTVEGHTSLTEYHGMNNRMMTKLRDDGFSESIIRKYDQPLTGVALPMNYYGYETIEGFNEKGVANTSDPKQVIKNSRHSLDIIEDDDINHRISDSLSKHLENLGYG